MGRVQGRADENKKGYQAWWQAELIQQLMDIFPSWKGRQGKSHIDCEVFLGNSPSEMPAEDDVTNPHQGPGLGSCGSPQKWLKFLGARGSQGLFGPGCRVWAGKGRFKD